MSQDAEHSQPEPAAARRSTPRGRPIRIAFAAAAAALLVAGLVLVITDPGSGEGALIESAAVLPLAEANGPATPGRTFAAGEDVVVRVHLRQGAWLTLLNVDPDGNTIAVMPFPNAPDYTIAVLAGVRMFGAYRLDEQAGREAFIVIASEKPIENLPGRVAKLPAGADLQIIADQVAAWGGETRVLPFSQTARPATMPATMPKE